MAVTTFIPTIWDAELKQALGKKLVSQHFVNHNYEGKVMGAGSVKINQLDDVVLSDYTPGQAIEGSAVNTTVTTLLIDHMKVAKKYVDDVSAVQAAGDLRAPLVNNMARAIATDEDEYVFSKLVTEGTNSVGNDAPVQVTDAESAKAFVLAMKQAADDANIPDEGRALVCESRLHNLLLGDKVIGLAAPTSEGVIKTGCVGTLYGIDIYTSNNIEKGKAVLTTPQFATEARQIQNIEVQRYDLKDEIICVSVSGVVVTQPAGVIVGNVVFQ